MNQFDLAALRAIYVGSEGADWIRLAEFLSFLGSGWMLFGLLPFMVVPSLRRYRHRAISMLTMLLFTSVLVTLMKEAIARARPCQVLAWARMEGVSLPHDFSFPSGHSAGSFAAAAFVCMLDRQWSVPVLVLALLVGLSRIALGVHYPTDVLVGALLGASIGSAWGARLRKSERSPTSSWEKKPQ